MVCDLESKFGWAYKDYMPVNIFYDGPMCRIILTSGMARHNWRWLHLLRDNDIIVCALPWLWVPNDFRIEKEIFEQCGVSSDRVYVLSNEEHLVPHIHNCGFNGYFINKNCFLDENIFTIQNDVEKKYDAVLNARPEKWKNHHLARNISSLALIEGYCFDEAQRVDLTIIPYAYKNSCRLRPHEVSGILNQSRVGLCLSFVEGQCQSSSEYLMSGLPVVSVKSKGGRDVWYNDYNSVICDPTPDDTYTAVKRCIDLKRDPYRIRNDHICLAHKFREKFIVVLQSIADRFGCEVCMERMFKDKFSHKMMDRYTKHTKVYALLES